MLLQENETNENDNNLLLENEILMNNFVMHRQRLVT